MSKKNFYLLGILATLILGAYLYHKFCCCAECCNNKKTVVASAISSNSGETMNFSWDNQDFNYQYNGNFNFNKDGFSHLNLVNDSINLGILKLKEFIAKNPNNKINITGYALNSEKNTSAFPNLAIARANDVKNYFVEKGIESNKFELFGELRDNWKANNDTIFGPIGYSLKVLEANSKSNEINWNDVKASINANPLTLYFGTNQSEISLTEQERKTISELSTYLDNVPNAKLSVVGHTDNSGNRDINIKLGLERAEFAKSYLIKNGIKSDKIDASSKGPDQPIATNNNAEGKAKNRRTVIQIQ